MNNNNSIEISDVLRRNRIAIYGTGFVAKKFYELLKKGLYKNIECFLVTQKKDSKSIDGIQVKSICDFRNEKSLLVCIAVNEAVKTEIEDILNKYDIVNYIWVSPYLTELNLGKPIKRGIKISVNKIVRQCTDYRLAVRYLAVENFFEKNDFGYYIYKKAQELHCEKGTAEKRLRSFCNLIQNWETYGYSSHSRILIDENYGLLDGAHRIAVARYYGMDEIICDIFKSSAHYFEWCGSDVLLTKTKIQEAGFTTEEQRAIEDAYKRIRRE